MAIKSNPDNPTPTWISPTLGNSWVNFGGSYTTAGYYKDNEGIVRLRGVIKNGTLSTAIFTLPVGFRPAAQHYFISVGGAGLSAVLVGSDGVVQVGAYIASGTNAYVSLDQISFSTW